MPSHTGKQAASRGGLLGASGPGRSGLGCGEGQRCLQRGSRFAGWALGALLAVCEPAHAVEGLGDGDPIENTGGVDLDPWPGQLEASRLEGADGVDGAEAARGVLGGGARRRGLWLGVSGGMAVSPGERERMFGLLELGLSLDEWFGAGGAVRAASEIEAAGALGSDVESDMDVQLDTSEAAASGGGPGFTPFAPGTGLTTPALARPTFTSALATPAPAAPPPRSPTLWRASDTPTPSARASWVQPERVARAIDPASAAALARAAVSEALRLQGSGTELRRLDSMASRSRAAASLPEVRLGAGTSRDESLRLSPTLSDPAHFSRDGGRDLWLEARLIWRLDGAIFARDEIAIMRLRAQQREGAAQRSREVLEALLDWQRARLVLASPLAPPEEVDAATVRHFGAVARLDIYTDGWFSRQLARWGAAAP
jgi:hypothetical protein